MPDPATRYRARTVIAIDAATTSGWSEIPQELPAASPLDPSSDSTPEDWGPRTWIG
ncbi:hypothetical protein TIFTF001_034104 [Ficus carica]|uniref:Uncharacterized protein n=1 Tax=Ficus carica TaxID=3494 RepID=A0AA88DZN7_FICCA|nr:hypothetical protein TIFTF001_034104 [Ficus carica]